MTDPLRTGTFHWSGFAFNLNGNISFITKQWLSGCALCSEAKRMLFSKMSIFNWIWCNYNEVINKSTNKSHIFVQLLVRSQSKYPKYWCIFLCAVQVLKKLCTVHFYLKTIPIKNVSFTSTCIEAIPIFDWSCFVLRFVSASLISPEAIFLFISFSLFLSFSSSKTKNAFIFFPCWMCVCVYFFRFVSEQRENCCKNCKENLVPFINA